MAPRSTKAKKPSEVKVAEHEAPKRGRGKGKAAVEEELDEEMPVGEPVLPDIGKKTKRGKKVVNDLTEPENKSEESAPPAKRGRKKVAQETEDTVKENGDLAGEESPKDSEQIENDTESNGTAEEIPPSTGRGRKKQAKKETVGEKNEVKPGRGRKNKQESNESKEVEDKPKGRGRGRKAQAKDEPEEEKTELEEEIKDKPAARGRKGQAKTIEKEEKVEDSEKDDPEDNESEDKLIEDTKKPKGRKGRKAAPKDDQTEKIEETKKKKVTSKEEEKNEKAKEEDAGEEVAEAKPAKSKRGPKKAESNAAVEAEGGGEPANKRRRRPAEDSAPEEETKKKAPLKNKSVTNYDEIDFTNNSKNDKSKEWNFKISSWNVDGIRAWAGKGGLDYLKYEKPDILCVQETKCSQDKLPEEVANYPGYHAYWLAGDKEGYAGVAIYTAKLAMSVQYGLQNEELDTEGRVITAEYEQFYLVCTYVPNAGRKLVTLPKRLQWNEEFRKYVIELDKKKPVIICGDMNVSHNEIDLANPAANRRNAGFSAEERAGLSQLLAAGFVDSFRRLHGAQRAYTFWTYMSNSRAKNVGWRLDYFIVSERLLPSLCDSAIRDKVYGSDHCPITLFLHLTSAAKPKE